MTRAHPVLVFVVLMLAVACAPAAQPGPATATVPATAAAASTATTVPATATPAGTAAALATTCRAPATPTTAMTEGPFFKAGSPERPSLVTAGMSGTRVVLTGYVLTRSCAPVANAKVDLWQADAAGNYDNAGFTLRGHVRTDARGVYRIETIVPAEYPGRTPHIHVRVEPPGGGALTTQVYFPDQPRNASDGIFRSENLLAITQGTPLVGRFDFILSVA